MSFSSGWIVLFGGFGCWRSPSFLHILSIQTDYSLGGINFQLQIQNRAARRINFHHRDRSVGISAENLSLQIQILSLISYEYLLQIQISGSKRINSVIISATAVFLVTHIARYCDTIIAITAYRAIPFQGGSHFPKWSDNPAWCSVSCRHICASPHKDKHERVEGSIATSIARCENQAPKEYGWRFPGAKNCPFLQKLPIFEKNCP